MNRKKKRDKQANLEKELILNAEGVEKKRKERIVKGITDVSLGLVIAMGMILLSFGVVRAIGKSSLENKSEAAPELVSTKTQEELTEQEKENWEEGFVKYKEQIYAYNDDILTFLFMGIDKSEEVNEAVNEAEETTQGGQADALFLLVLNPHDKTIKVIGINRNTMTDIDIYNDTGSYMTTVSAQIAVQHGFGNGMEESCEYQVKAVKNLFYNLPIHGYCAINMDAISTITDMIGGMELTALDDIKPMLPDEEGRTYIIRKGQTVVLDGKTAYSYVRFRDIEIAGSADMRLKRQQQFLEQFIQKAKKKTMGDLTFPVKLYNSIAPDMVTDVTIDEVAYLASTMSGYQFNSSQFYSLKGETVMGETFEEYYIDEDALYEMILDIFYEPVERKGSDDK